MHLKKVVMANKSNRKLWSKYVEKKSKGSTPRQANNNSSQSRGSPFSGVILGIDPSLRGSGFSVIKYVNQKAELLNSITLRINTKSSMAQCLGMIANKVEFFLNQYAIDHVAVEQTIYVQNFQTAQIMGAARGAAIAPVAMRNIDLFEYAPLRIKQAIVGNGRASKQQVSKMTGALLEKDFGDFYDESDASAVALCHAFTWKNED